MRSIIFFNNKIVIFMRQHIRTPLSLVFILWIKLQCVKFYEGDLTLLILTIFNN